jgi:uncharacterized membrane protein YccC
MFVLVCAIGTNLPSSHLASYALGTLSVGLATAGLALTDRVRRVPRHVGGSRGTQAAAMRSESIRGLRRDLGDWFTLHYVRSPTPLMAARASLAVLASGTVAVAVSLPRPYWAMIAAGSIFSVGSYTAVAVERALLYLAGTLIGVTLAGALVELDTVGVSLALTLGMLMFMAELLVTRNYALAIVFITALALVLTNAAVLGQSAGGLLWTRTAETGIGCFFGLLAGLMVTRGWAFAQLRYAVLETASAMSELLTSTGGEQQRRQRALEHRLERLERVGQRVAHERRGVREQVVPLLPIIDATRKLGRRVLASGEHGTLAGDRDELCARVSRLPLNELRC